MLLFGPLADLAGWRSRQMEAASLQQLTERLAVSDPALGEALLGRGVQVAVNQQLVREDVILQPGAEVAYLPPMSGG